MSADQKIPSYRIIVPRMNAPENSIPVSVLFHEYQGEFLEVTVRDPLEGEWRYKISGLRDQVFYCIESVLERKGVMRLWKVREWYSVVLAKEDAASATEQRQNRLLKDFFRYCEKRSEAALTEKAHVA